VVKKGRPAEGWLTPVYKQPALAGGDDQVFSSIEAKATRQSTLSAASVS
jgi:hypothetical protein